MTDKSYIPNTEFGQKWVREYLKGNILRPESEDWNTIVDLLNIFQLPPYSPSDPLHLFYQRAAGKEFTVEELQTFAKNYYQQLLKNNPFPQRLESMNTRSTSVDPFSLDIESLGDTILNHILFNYDGTDLSAVMIALATDSLYAVYDYFFAWMNYDYTQNELLHLLQNIYLHSDPIYKLTNYEITFLNLFTEYRQVFYNILTHTRASSATDLTSDLPDDISSLGVFLYGRWNVLDPYEKYYQDLSKLPILYEIYNTVIDAGGFLERTGIVIPDNESIYNTIRYAGLERDLLNQIVTAQRSVRPPLPEKPDRTVYLYTDVELIEKYHPDIRTWKGLKDFRRQLIKMRK